MSRKRDGTDLPMETECRTSKSRLDTAESEIEAVMATYEQPLLRYAATLLPNPHAAQDAVQQTFIRLCSFGFPLPFDPPALRAWLYRTTAHAAIDLLRAEKRRAALHEKVARERPPLGASVSPDSDPDDPRLTRLRSALDRLSEPERQVVLLRLQQDLSYKEIAAVVGRPIGSVGRLLHEAVQKLTRWVNAKTPEAPP